MIITLLLNLIIINGVCTVYWVYSGYIHVIRIYEQTITILFCEE